MKCPFCSHENTRVIDSRPAEDNNSIRRRRVCDECGKRFTTYEKIETIPLIIIKKDKGTRLKEELGRKPTVEEVAKNMGVAENVVLEAIRLSSETIEDIKYEKTVPKE